MTSFEFVIFVASLRSKSSIRDHPYEEKHEIPSLYAYGDTDDVILKQMTVDFLQYFLHPQTLNHSGGHFVPATGSQTHFSVILQDNLNCDVSNTCCYFLKLFLIFICIFGCGRKWMEAVGRGKGVSRSGQLSFFSFFAGLN